MNRERKSGGGRNLRLPPIKIVVDTIRQPIAAPEPKEKKIGSRVREKGEIYKISGCRRARQADVS